MGYYVSTVGLNETIVRKYIREQDQEDIVLDKRMCKEYTDPFSTQQEGFFWIRLRVGIHGA